MTDKKTTMDIQEIMQCLRHRYPMLLIDKITFVEAGVRATAIKGVTFNEPHFQGHFPDLPVMPGVLIVEAMAQAAAAMVIADLPPEFQNGNVFFTGIRQAKFRDKVVPGDLLRFEVKSLRSSSRGQRQFWTVQGEAFVDDKLVAEAELAALITLE